LFQCSLSIKLLEEFKKESSGEGSTEDSLDTVEGEGQNCIPLCSVDLKA
jgi:hypothetical protein